jgi:hypothetical protein
MSIDHAVPDTPRFVVALIVGRYHATHQLLVETSQG